MHVGGTAIQSAMHLDAPDDLALAYTRAMMACLLFKPEPRDVLMIGLGGGSLAKYIHRQLPRTRVLALEIDLRVVDAAYRFFHLPLGKRRLRVIVGDGAAHVARHPESADVILLDAFHNHRQAPSIRTRTFYEAAAHALRRGGVLAVNFMTDDPGLRAYLGRLSASFGARLAGLRARGEENLIVFAFRDDPGALDPAALASRGAALERLHGIEFRDFAQRLRPLTRIRVDGRPLASSVRAGAR